MHRLAGQAQGGGGARPRVMARTAPWCPPGEFLLALALALIGAALVAALALLSAPPAAAAEPMNGGHQGRQLLQQAAAMFFPETHEASDRAAGSATATLNHLKYIAAQGTDLAGAQPSGTELALVTGFLERPDWLMLTRETGHFRIHFTADPANAPLGWPYSDAYLKAAERACEQAWSLYHEPPQAWLVPPSIDGPGSAPLVHVYIMDLGSGVFGYALHEDLLDREGHAGYVVVDNDFSGFDVSSPLDALAVTLAHEYHHVVQFGYGYDPEAHWFMEQTATMEESHFSWQPAEMRRNLEAFGSHAYRRLDLTNGYFEYGSWLWPQFIVERWGWETLREIWHTWAGGALPMLAAAAVVLEEAESLHEAPLMASRPDADVLDAAVLEWATRNVLLGEEQAVPGHQHARGAELPAVIRAEGSVGQFPLSGLAPEPTRQPEPLGASYVVFNPQAGSADNVLIVELSASPGLAGAQLIVLDATGGSGHVVPGTIRDGQCSFEVQDWQRPARAVLVLTTGLGSPNACAYRVSASTHFSPKTSAGVDPPAAGAGLVWLRAAPNPFEPFTVLQYELPAQELVRVRIIDAQGRLVTSLYEGTASAGRHGIYWDGRGAGGSRAAAGVYYGLLETSLGTREVRVVRVR